MLMAIFVADIQKDIDTIDDKTFLQVVFFCGLVVLVASAALAQWYTRKAIRCQPQARSTAGGLEPLMAPFGPLLAISGLNFRLPKPLQASLDPILASPAPLYQCFMLWWK